MTFDDLQREREPKIRRVLDSAIHIESTWVRVETALNYWIMVEIYPNLKEEVGGSILSCEISSLLDIKLAMWSTAFCALALACRPSVS